MDDRPNADVDVDNSAAIAAVDGPNVDTVTTSEAFEDIALLAVPIAIAILGLVSSTYANHSNDDATTSTTNVDVQDGIIAGGDGLLRDGIFLEEGIAAALASSLVDRPTIGTVSSTQPPIVPEEEDLAIALAATLR
jgi:hypothetical protein